MMQEIAGLEAAMIAVIITALLLVVYRLFKGPSVLDRLLAYSSLSAKIIVFLVFEDAFSGQISTFYINLALIYAVLSFLGIVVVARFVEEEGESW
jgi:multicomponent Na+:H+ antiporter subunit F